MAGDFDISDGDWENSGIDDFARRQAQVCRICGDDTDEDDTPICAACRAQPARLNNAD